MAGILDMLRQSTRPPRFGGTYGLPPDYGIEGIEGIEGVTPSSAEFNPETGEIEVGGQLPPQADYARWAQRLQQESAPVQEVPGLTPAIRRGEAPTATAGTPTAEITGTVPEEGGGLSPDKRAMLLRLMSGLTTAGRRMTSVPTLSDLQRGRQAQPFKPETQLAGAAGRIEEEERGKKAETEAEKKAIEEGKTSPLVAAGKQTAEAMGLPPENIQTDSQAESILKFAGQSEKIKLLKAQREAIEGKTEATAAQAKLNEADMAAVEAGDLSKLPKDARDALNKKKDAFYTNARINKLKTTIDSAESIMSRIDVSKSYGATSAFRSLARAAGEVGRLTDQDILDFSQRMGIKGLYDKAHRFGKSALSPELKKEIFKLAKQYIKDSTKQFDKEVDSRVRDLTTTYSYLPKDAVRKFFVGEEEEAEDTVTVRGADNLKYTGVSRKDAEEGMRTGEILEIIEE